MELAASRNVEQRILACQTNPDIYINFHHEVASI